MDGFRLVQRRDPASEEVESLGGLRAGFGGVREDREAAIGGQLQHLVGQAEVADDRVVDILRAEKRREKPGRSLRYSASVSPEPPSSSGKSFIFGSPSFIGITVDS
jgi:hypothetical protein